MRGWARTAEVILAVLLTACGSNEVPQASPGRAGPPRIVAAAVESRARWFDIRDPHRRAGTDAELVAGSYLLARLEQAGYLVNLDPVPVGNLLHTTNVIALAPSGEPKIVVIVDYDTAPSAPSDGVALGTFLEVARALRARDPHHSVEFAALSAEHTAVNGGQVGARSLIELLKQLQPAPLIVRVGAISPQVRTVSLAGPQAAAMQRVTSTSSIRLHVTDERQNDVFTKAGFSETVVAGSLSGGTVLLDYLSSLAKTP